MTEITSEKIEKLIKLIRGQRVMRDRDLAKLYLSKHAPSCKP